MTASAHPDQPALPRWIRLLLALMAAVQAAIAVVTLAAVPPEWSSLFGLPPRLVGAIMAAAAVIVTGLAGLAGLRPSSRSALAGYGMLQALRRHPASAILPIVCLGPLLFLIASPWAGHVLIGVQFGLAALLLHLAALDSRFERPARWEAAVPLIVIAAGIGLRVWHLLEGGFGDEGAFVSTMANLVRGGGLASEVLHLPPDSPHQPAWGWSIWLYGVWARLFGIGAIQARSLGLVFGLVALPVMAAIARRQYGTRAALVTASLAGISFLGLLTVSGRHNAMPMLAFALVIYAHTVLRDQPRPALHLIAGALAALSLETHLLNLSLLAALGGVYGMDYLAGIRRGERWLRADPLWYFVAGAVPVLILYYALHILTLPHPDGYLDYLAGFGESGGLADSLTGRLAAAAKRYRILWAETPAECLLILASAAAALTRRTAADRHWLLLLVFTEVGYLLFNPLNVIDNDYTAFALPVLFGASGALVTHGFRREPRPGSRWERAAYAVVVAALLAFTIRHIRANHAARQAAEARHRPIIEYVRGHLPPGETILAPDFYYPSLVEYRLIFPPDYDIDTTLAPALAGMEFDAYWQQTYLDTWPRIVLDSSLRPRRRTYDSATLIGSYLASRQATQPVDYVWAVDSYPLITDAPYASPNGARLQMVAHGQLPAVRSGSTLEITTIWVTRGAIPADTTAALELSAPSGQAVALGSVPLIGGWNGAPTAQWESYRFYDVRAAVDLPAGLPAGEYFLRVSLSPSGPEAACQPACAFDVSGLSVRR
jgi:hypothetical protein